MKSSRSFYFIVPSYFYRLFEVWLSKMSRKGWHLASYRGLKYTFLQGLPRETTYFIYHCGGFRADDGKYSLQLRFWNILGSFGLPIGQSKLNRYTKKHPTYLLIIEIAPKKLHTEEYAELLCTRKNVYFSKTLRTNIIIIIASIILLILNANVGLLVGFFSIVLMLTSINTMLALAFFIAESVHRNK